MKTSSRSSIANRACGSCTKRKVKCDSAEPCANCRISLLACQYAIIPKKRSPKASQIQSNIGRCSPHPPGAEKRLLGSFPAEPHRPQENPVSSGNSHGSPQSMQLPSMIALMDVEVTLQTTHSTGSAQT